MRDLPDSPSFEHLKRQAKSLLRAHRQGDEVACSTLRWLLRFRDESDARILDADLSLQEVQRALALEYGFHGWAALREFVEGKGAGAEEALVNPPESILKQWQIAVDALARSIGVPAALVMRVCREDIEVFLKSRGDRNPYRVGQGEGLVGSGLYCERVISTQQRLRVPHAPSDPEWENNPDVALEMIAYLGLPLLLPNGVAFGTICVLDSREHRFTPADEDLLRCMKGMIESHLDLLFTRRVLDRRKEQLAASLGELQHLEHLVPICSYCRCIRVPEQGWRPLDQVIGKGAGIRFSHGICPHCMEKMELGE